MHINGEVAIQHTVSSFQDFIMSEYGTPVKIIGVLVILFVIDIFSGMYRNRKKIASGKISEGFIKKGFELVILLAFFFIQMILPDYIGISILTLFLILALYNELISILENLYQAGVDLKFLMPLVKLLDVHEQIKSEVKADDSRSDKKSEETSSDGEIH